MCGGRACRWVRMICLSVAASDVDSALRQVRRYRRCVDMCELRVDYLTTHVPSAIAQFPARLGRMRTILTVRREVDGGRYAGSEAQRRGLILDILRASHGGTPFTHVDLEVDIRGVPGEEICAAAARVRTTVIRSVHAFSYSADKTAALLEQVTVAADEIGKVAVAVDSLQEVCTIVEQLQAFRSQQKNRERAVIVIAMGEYGRVLRIISNTLNLYCTYCSVQGHGTEMVAPTPRWDTDGRTCMQGHGAEMVTPTPRWDTDGRTCVQGHGAEMVAPTDGTGEVLSDERDGGGGAADRREHADQAEHGALAPGQLDPIELERVYNYRGINTDTALFAIIGNPIGHSKSPQFHNHVFRTQHINACYVPIQCESVRSFYHFTQLVPIAGFSVTLPHKEQVIEYLNYVDITVKMIGACNTVVVQNGKWRGYNTDLHGFDFPLHKMHMLTTQDAHTTQNEADVQSTQNVHTTQNEADVQSTQNVHTTQNKVAVQSTQDAHTTQNKVAVPSTQDARTTQNKAAVQSTQGTHLNERRALVIGAGGVARTACFSLLHHGYRICIVNRSPKRLHALINQISTHYDRARITPYPLSKSHLSSISTYTQLIVQTTSVGMHPHTAQDPLLFYPFRGNETVYDLIYNPEYTALLRRAKNAGCTIISGTEMFRAQADAQSTHFIRSARSQSP